MSRANPVSLAGFLGAVLLFMVIPAFWKGGVFLTAFEGDALHVVDIVMRMHLGQIPHVDFHTPLGALAFLPVVLGLDAGFGLGDAYLIGQATMGALILPAALWAAWTRLPRVAAFAFAAMPIVVMTSLSYGTSEPPVTIAMHYNRWAWAIAFVAAVMIALPRDPGRSSTIDGVVLGACLAGLALIKLPFFVVLAPLAALALLMRGDLRTLLATLAVGLASVGAMTVAFGFGYWTGYANDIIAVSQSEIRQYPGLDFSAVAVSPPYLVLTLTGVGAALVLRHGGQRETGLILLLLVPGFIYLTFQNFGNDALWAIPLAAVLLATRPEVGTPAPFGLEARSTMTVLAALAIAMSIPHAQSLGAGALRHLALPAEKFEPLIASENVVFEGVYVSSVRANTTRAGRDLIVPDAPFAALAEDLDAKEPVMVAGEPLPDCRFESGIVGALRLIADDIAVEGGGDVFVADMLAPHWMLTGSAPLQGASPWNYGETNGLSGASEVVVPICAVSTASRRGTLAQIEAEGVVLRELSRTPRIIRYAVSRN